MHRVAVDEVGQCRVEPVSSLAALTRSIVAYAVGGAVDAHRVVAAHGDGTTIAT
jgi:hypothetical protein